jgi:hypothetical protein
MCLGGKGAMYQLALYDSTDSLSHKFWVVKHNRLLTLCWRDSGEEAVLALSGFIMRCKLPPFQRHVTSHVLCIVFTYSNHTAIQNTLGRRHAAVCHIFCLFKHSVGQDELQPLKDTVYLNAPMVLAKTCFMYGADKNTRHGRLYLFPSTLTFTGRLLPSSALARLSSRRTMLCIMIVSNRNCESMALLT